MDDVSFKQDLRATRPFGCLPAGLLACGMGAIVFVGTSMGDCAPGAGCHDHDGWHIMVGLFWTLMLVAPVGLVAWFVAGVVRMALRPWIGGIATNAALVVMVILIVWFGFNPLMWTLLAIEFSATQ